VARRNVHGASIHHENALSVVLFFHLIFVSHDLYQLPGPDELDMQALELIFHEKHKTCLVGCLKGIWSLINADNLKKLGGLYKPTFDTMKGICYKLCSLFPWGHRYRPELQGVLVEFCRDMSVTCRRRFFGRPQDWSVLQQELEYQLEERRYDLRRYILGQAAYRYEEGLGEWVSVGSSLKRRETRSDSMDDEDKKSQPARLETIDDPAKGFPSTPLHLEKIIEQDTSGGHHNADQSSRKSKFDGTNFSSDERGVDDTRDTTIELDLQQSDRYSRAQSNIPLFPTIRSTKRHRVSDNEDDPDRQLSIHSSAPSSNPPKPATCSRKRHMADEDTDDDEDEDEDELGSVAGSSNSCGRAASRDSKRVYTKRQRLKPKTENKSPETPVLLQKPTEAMGKRIFANGETDSGEYESEDELS
jgi:hypothetical protein